MREILRETPLSVIGDRVRLHRNAMRLSIRDLAGRALVSKTSIVALEQGKSCRPSTLAKVCEAMNLHIERLTKAPGETEVANPIHHHEDDRWYDLQGLVSGPLGGVGRALSPEERAAFHQQGLTAQMLMFENVPPEAGFIAGIIELTGPTELRSHGGTEWVYVLEGRAEIMIEGKAHRIGKGESALIRDGESHSYAPSPEANEPVSILAIRVV